MNGQALNSIIDSVGNTPLIKVNRTTAEVDADIYLKCEFFKGAQYDDLLRMKTTVLRAKGVRIVHRYEIFLDDELIVRGETTVAAVDPNGKVVRLPEFLKMK